MENRAKTPGRVVGIICHSFMAYLQKKLKFKYAVLSHVHFCRFFQNSSENQKIEMQIKITFES